MACGSPPKPTVGAEKTHAAANGEDAAAAPDPRSPENPDAAPTPGAFVERVVFSGLDAPTGFRFARDGRVFVAEKGGLIKQFDSLAAESASVVADLRPAVHGYGDRGLLDIELDPSFPARPFLYALYTLDGRLGDSEREGTVPRYQDTCPDPKGVGCIVAARLVRLRLEGDLAARNRSEEVLVENWAQQFSSHSIGSLAFGPDGMLYVAAGDGASFERVDYGDIGGNLLLEPPDLAKGSQRPPLAMGGALRAQVIAPPQGFTPSFAGKVIRFDPAVAKSTVVAAGLRNPFRIAFRPGTRELWLGDVGWSVWEEINRVPDVLAPAASGVANFGWPCLEGGFAQPGYEAAGLQLCQELYARPASHVGPAFAYRHDAEVVAEDGCGKGGSAISGLAFAGTGAYPGGYDGNLFFSDFSRRCIWSLPLQADGAPDPARLTLLLKAAGKPVQLHTGPEGDLYYADLDGTIRRIEFESGNHPPRAVIDASALLGPLPWTVKLDGSRSEDADAEDLVYDWDLDGDGAFGDAQAAVVETTFTKKSRVVVGLRVTDRRGAVSQATLVLWPGHQLPVPAIELVQPARWRVGDEVKFSGAARDGDGRPLPPEALAWSLVLLHCPDACHEHPLQQIAGAASGAFVAPDHEYPMRLSLRLTARDEAGLSASVATELLPETAEVTLDSRPRGLALAFNGTRELTPFRRTVILGSRNSLAAPSQILGTSSARFVRWSNRREQNHAVQIRRPAVFTAVFDEVPLVALQSRADAVIVTHAGDALGASATEVIRDGVAPSGASAAGELVTRGTPLAEDGEVFVGYEFAQPATFARLVFQEGQQHADGGFFDALRVEVKSAETWTIVQDLRIAPAYTGGNGRSWESFTLDFEPTLGDGIRVIGRAGGSARFIAVAELEVWGLATAPKP